MESMTGYAFYEGKTPQFSFAITLKSLNSRYIEIFVNMPKILRNEENEIIGLIKDYVERGKIELTIDILEWTTSRSISINTDLLQKYNKELHQIEKNSENGKQFSLDALLTLDGVIQRERSVMSKESREIITKNIIKIIKQAIGMRKREGKSIEKDILNSIQYINKNVMHIKKISKNVAKKYYTKIKKRIDGLLSVEVDQVRLYTEIAILADKLDINEEVSRLNDHIQKFKKTVKEPQQIGKKLDFLAQEMFREINTIASKSNDSEISHISVEVKNYIDKIREQCRNIV